jgi:AcrR family transcriptional regulator
MKSKAEEKKAASLPVRERLLNSACKLFYKEGVQAVGIERLLEDSDAAKASLYSNFGSKDALVVAYLERQGETMRRNIEERLNVDVSPRERLLLLFDIVAGTLDEEYRGCPFQNAAGELSDPTHPGRAVIERQRQWLVKLVRSLVAAAGFATEPLSHALIALYDGMVAGSIVERSGVTRKSARWAMERLLSESVDQVAVKH